MPHGYNLRKRKTEPINEGDKFVKKAKKEPKNEGEKFIKKAKKEKPTPAPPTTTLSVPSTSTSAVKSETTTSLPSVLVFGDDTAGEMGLGEIGISKKSPFKLESIPDKIVQVACGAMHTLCLTSGGEIYSFGCNDEMALGRETNGDEELDSTPAKISLPDKATKVTAGDSHSASLTVKGHVYVWGNFKDEHGSVGLTPESNGKPSVKPIRIMEETVFKDIASGSDHMLLADSEGKVYSFGVAEQGQLGRIDKNDLQQIKLDNRELYLRPALVDFSKVDPKRPFICDAVFAGNFSSFAINTDKVKNRLAGWGLNNYSQLGYKGAKEKGKEQLVQYFAKRSQFTCSTSMRFVACGQHHTLFLTSSGRVYSAGRPEYGRLGLGKLKDVVCPAKCLDSLKNEKVVDISAGTSTSFAVTDEGE